ncbi:AAA family ATPase [Phaeodactylibacter xiamenensis]|uniref:AAA family ATPase n=1 Tax=Phaeodactylibacter xiamenensis TaxID=1524460 RepID=UPI003CCB7559
MLIDFSVQNYRSFFQRQTLSLKATRITEFQENVFLEDSSQSKLLKVMSVYGANSSGKSNLLRAMGRMKAILFENFQQRSNESISHDPFLLSEKSGEEPTVFEILFATKMHVYRYGFEFNESKFTGEWLFEHKGKEQHPYFIRIEDGIQVFETFLEGNDLEEKTRDNALFLSVVNQFNGPISKEVIDWFNNFNIIDGVGHTDYRAVTFKMLEDDSTKAKLMDFYRGLDLGFNNLFIDKTPFDPSKLPFEIPQEVADQMSVDMQGRMMASLNSIHDVFDDSGVKTREENFHVRTQESSGTNKIIDLSGPIFDTLLDGGTLVIDELDAKLHPHLTIALIRLFQLDETNPKKAQLIFATHNTNILSLGRLRRDQIIFSEKTHQQCTEIYSLVDYKLDKGKVRKDNSFEKDYLLGRYGAVPSISDLSTPN